ncbi:MAG: rhodanese-like domain-containing protein [Bacteroidales bacterium]
MKRNYIIPALIFLLLAAGLAFIPEQKHSKEAKPEEVFASLNLPFRYITTDEVASRIIKDDPSLLLVDVRDEKEFIEFSLENAINIPLNKLTDPEFIAILEQTGMDYIFYSNGDIIAENAWILCSRMGLKNLYIMKGGLNRWVETILDPAEPPQTASAEVWDQYAARKAARQYFLGSNGIPGTDTEKQKNATPKPKTIRPVKSSGSKGSEGC